MSYSSDEVLIFQRFYGAKNDRIVCAKMQDPILLFLRTFSLKSVLDVDAPAPSNGKSWILFEYTSRWTKQIVH